MSARRVRGTSLRDAETAQTTKRSTPHLTRFSQDALACVSAHLTSSRNADALTGNLTTEPRARDTTREVHPRLKIPVITVHIHKQYAISKSIRSSYFYA